MTPLSAWRLAYHVTDSKSWAFCYPKFPLSDAKSPSLKEGGGNAPFQSTSFTDLVHISGSIHRHRYLLPR